MLQPELTFTNDERFLEINFGNNNTLRSINISQNSKEHTIQNSLHFRHKRGIHGISLEKLIKLIKN